MILVLALCFSLIFIYRFLKKKYTPIDFTNKTIWITGASSGIGEALAYSFSSKGASLILTSRRESELDRVRKACKYPDRVELFPIDLSKSKEIEGLVSEFLAINNKKIDILINNAGLSMRAECLKHTLDQDIYLLQVNLISYIAMTKAVLRNMITRNQGHIVAISSIQGKLGIANRTTYAASKHGVIGYFDSLRAELASTNINVTVICPGYVKTLLNHNASYSKQIEEKEMTEKGMDPSEFANIVSRGVYYKEKEMIIDNSILSKIAVAFRNIFSNLVFSMIAKRKK